MQTVSPQPYILIFLSCLSGPLAYLKNLFFLPTQNVFPFAAHSAGLTSSLQSTLTALSSLPENIPRTRHRPGLSRCSK